MRIYNTPTKKIEELKTLVDGEVSIYTCGPTVYDYPHVGNWAAYIYWDSLVRVLIDEGYKVNRVMNITDVGHLTSDADEGEDKLEKGAQREGKTAWEIAEFYKSDFIEGMKKLNMIMPTHIAKATDFIGQQLDLVRTLKSKGYTYQITDGIYFDTSKFPSYADFAHLDLKAQKAGARVVDNQEKKQAWDFALWKFTPAGQKRDMEWETPSDLLEGADEKDKPVIMGFPGWHLECSAIAMSLLGTTIDIHTGGIDHIPVHHTNEIAQSESATGERFANYWLHNNHLKVDGSKISKSLGNGFTLSQLAEKGFSADGFRMFVLHSQFRSEGNFTFENLQAAKNRLRNWRNFAALRHQTHDRLVDDDEKNDSSQFVSIQAAAGKIREALRDNLNTPEALNIIDQAFGDIENRPLEAIHQHGLIQFIETIDSLLGLRLVELSADIDDEAKRLIIERNRAREAKDWQLSDEIRAKLEDKNIAIRDTASGPIWYYLD